MRSFVRARAALVAALALAGTACDSCHNETTTTTVRGVGGGGVGVAGSTGGDAAAAGDGSTANPVQRITITSPLTSGWILVGEYRGAAHSAATVVLVHQLSSNHGEWAPLVARLHSGPNPLATFAIDLRGHGESTHRSEEGVVSSATWQSFGNDRAQWAGVVDDVRAALEWVRSRPDAGRIVVAGSSIGSTAALLASQNEPLVSAVVMISPGVDYRGLDTLAPMRAWAASGRPALLIAGQGDTESASSVGQLMAAAAGDPRVQREVYDGTGAHGVSLAAPGVRPAMWERIEGFIREAINPLNQPPQPPHSEGSETTGGTGNSGAGSEPGEALPEPESASGDSGSGSGGSERGGSGSNGSGESGTGESGGSGGRANGGRSGRRGSVAGTGASGDGRPATGSAGSRRAQPPAGAAVQENPY